jgi:hypothetical protein
MTQIVHISGPEAGLRGLMHIPGLDIAIHSVRTNAAGALQITAYATDTAVSEVQSRGLTVEVVVDAQTLADQTKTLFAQIERTPDETIEAGPL